MTPLAWKPPTRCPESSGISPAHAIHPSPAPTKRISPRPIVSVCHMSLFFPGIFAVLWFSERTSTAVWRFTFARARGRVPRSPRNVIAL